MTNKPAAKSGFFSDLINVFAESLEPVQKTDHTRERDILNDNKGSPEPADDFGDGWEKVSHQDLRLDGMPDPFANNFKKMCSEYRTLSDFAVKYDSWTLRAMMVKADDDVRQEVLAIQLMKRL